MANIKRGGEIAAHGIGQVGNAASRLAKNNGGAAGHAIGQAGKTLGRIGARGGERTGHYAGRAGHGIGNVAKNVANKVGDKVIDKAGQGFAAETAGASIIAAQIIKRHKKETLMLLLIILCAVLMPFFFVLYILIGGNQDLQDQKNSQNPLQVTVTCTPAQLSVGETSICTITVTDSQDIGDITVAATIYPFAQYVKNSASVDTGTVSKPAGTYDATNHTVTWDAQKLNLPLTAPINLVFTLKVQKTVNKNGVPIVVTANGSGGAGGTIPSGGNYNTRTWAIALLQGLGIPQSTGAIAAIMHWEQEEGGNWHNQAKYNPLNTTYPEPGSSTFSSVGAGSASIRIYTSWHQGLDATVKTLENGSYGPILTALKSGDYNAVGQAVLSSPWGTTQW
jgi:hypothetical protein